MILETMEIGREYLKTVQVLRKLIQQGVEIPEADAENHACFFCRKRIYGKMRVIDLEDSKGSSEFYLDEECYRHAREFEEVGRFYFCLN